MKYSSITKISLLIVLIILASSGWLYYSFNNSLAMRIRHVVVISMDTTRADMLGCYGHLQKPTPNIDALAKEGILFENTISPIPLTLASHSTMLTGTNPLYHGVHDNLHYHLDSSHVTIAEILKDRGFSTGAVVGSFILNSQFGLDQGFDYYNDDFEEEMADTYISQRRGGETSRIARKWIDDHHKEKMFLFLHYYDPHMNYDPPAPYDTMFQTFIFGQPQSISQLWNLYIGEIAYTDHCIGQVVDKLKELGIYDSTLIIVTADHGEMLGSHAEATHGYFIYQPAVRVPLIFKLPGRLKQSKIQKTVGLVDIVPTICSLLNIEPSSFMQGEDISPYLFKDGPVDLERQIYCESLVATKYKCNSLLALVSDRYKYIQTTRPELYDIIVDPLENNNLIDGEPQRARILQDLLKQMIENSVSDEGLSSKTELDDETVARLESLGYVSGEVTEDFSFDQSKNDPKDLIGYHFMNSQSELLRSEKKYDDLKELSKEMIELRPDLYYGYMNLALAAQGKKDHASAIAPLEKAIELEPDNAEFHFLLSIAYSKEGDLEKSADSSEKSLQIDPDQYDVHAYLSGLLFEQKQFEPSLFHLQESLRLKPGNLEVLHGLGLHAWVRATSKVDEYYDPPQALILARQAMKLSSEKRADLLAVLAAAHAANGNFPEAVKNARQAVKLAISMKNKRMVMDMRKQLKLYRNRQAYRE